MKRSYKVDQGVFKCVTEGNEDGKRGNVEEMDDSQVIVRLNELERVCEASFGVLHSETADEDLAAQCELLNALGPLGFED